MLLKIIDLTIGLRVSAEQEDEGLDVAEHGEKRVHAGLGAGGWGLGAEGGARHSSRHLHCPYP